MSLSESALMALAEEQARARNPGAPLWELRQVAEGLVDFYRKCQWTEVTAAPLVELRDIRFKSVPVEVAELLREQVNAAMQIVAALVLTDEEVLRYRQNQDPELRPEALGNWATSMKEELRSPQWRAKLVEVVCTQGFLTNTHPGYPIGALENTVPPEYLLGGAFRDLEKLLRDYANGVGAAAPEADDRKVWEADYKAFWVAALRKKGHEEEVAAWCMERIGYLLALRAEMERIMRPKRMKMSEVDVQRAIARMTPRLHDVLAPYAPPTAGADRADRLAAAQVHGAAIEVINEWRVVVFETLTRLVTDEDAQVRSIAELALSELNATIG